MALFSFNWIDFFGALLFVLVERYVAINTVIVVLILLIFFSLCRHLFFFSDEKKTNKIKYQPTGTKK